MEQKIRWGGGPLWVAAQGIVLALVLAGQLGAFFAFQLLEPNPMGGFLYMNLFYSGVFCVGAVLCFACYRLLIRRERWYLPVLLQGAGAVVSLVVYLESLRQLVELADLSRNNFLAIPYLCALALSLCTLPLLSRRPPTPQRPA